MIVFNLKLFLVVVVVVFNCVEKINLVIVDSIFIFINMSNLIFFVFILESKVVFLLFLVV